MSWRFRNIRASCCGPRPCERPDRSTHDAVVKVLETGLSIEGPAGKVAMDPKTHHCALDIHLMVVKDQKLTIIDTAAQRPPADTAQYCDLQKNPDDNKQYEVKI